MDLIRRQYLDEINNRIMPFVDNNEGIFGKILFGDFESKMSLTSMLLFRGFFHINNGSNREINEEGSLFYRVPFLALLKVNSNRQFLEEMEWASATMDMRPSEFIYLASFLYKRREGMGNEALSYLKDRFLEIVKDTAPQLVPYFAYVSRESKIFGAYTPESRILYAHSSGDSVLIIAFIRFCKHIRSNGIVNEVRERLRTLLLSIMVEAEHFQEFAEKSEALYEEYQRKHKRLTVSRRHEKRISEIAYRYLALFIRREQAYLNRISCIEDYGKADQLMEALLHETVRVEVVPKNGSARGAGKGGLHGYKIVNVSCARLGLFEDSYHFRFRNIIEFLAERLFKFHMSAYSTS